MPIPFCSPAPEALLHLIFSHKPHGKSDTYLNLRCFGCYTLGYQKHPGLPYDFVKRILRECTDLGLHFVTVLGGEPFMCPSLLQMIEEHPQIFFQIYTNGTLMTKEKAARVRDLGNTMVVVSCEGYEEEAATTRCASSSLAVDRGFPSAC